MKKALLVLALLFSVVILASCGDKTELTNVEFTGIDDVTNIAYDSEFNVLSGVKAMGDDGKDYSNVIEYLSTATIVADKLDTKRPGQISIKYTVEVGGEKWSRFRYLTVLEPAAVEGEMLVNKDFALGLGGWNSDKVVFIADGAQMTLSAEAGILKADVVSGSNVYTPRFGQMNVPFEKDTTYEISFKAKSSVEKTININVGEILDGAPYFTDFKDKQVEHFVLTTEWQEFSFKFTHKLDNKNGGIIFEMGNVVAMTDAVLEFDWVEVEVATADADTKAPSFEGLAVSKTILIGTTFDPKVGVTAFDLTDGDVTDDITVVIKNALDAVVTTVDTTEETTYEITYTVTDAAGNKATHVMTLEVVGMQFSEENLIVNGDFSEPLNVEKPEWTIWAQDWGTAAVVTGAINATDGTYELDITNSGDGGEAWTIQFAQRVSLVEGKTYRAKFDVKSSANRDMNFVIVEDVVDFEQFRFNAIALTSEFVTYEFVFTALKTTEVTKFEFDLGQTPNYQASKVTLDNISLNEALLDETVKNGNFDKLGFQAFHNDWEGSVANLSVVNDEFVYTLEKYNKGASFALQIIYLEKLVLKANTAYTFKIDMYATSNINLTPFFTQGEAGGWNNVSSIESVALTDVKQTFIIPVTSGANGELPYDFKFEFGLAFESFEAGVESATAEKVYFDNVSFMEDSTSKELILNGDATTVRDFVYDNAGEGEGTMVLNDGKAVINVTKLGQAAYTPHFYQMIDHLQAGSYRLKLVMTSNVSRDFRLNLVLPDAGYASLLPDTKYDFDLVADTETVIYVDFVVTDLVANVKLELDFGLLGDGFVSEKGIFTISEVMVYQNLNS